MIDPKGFIETLGGMGVDLLTGVPDSLMEPFCSAVADSPGRGNHIMAANEGAAIGIGIGHYLRTSNPALVYLQNAGIGNAVNPLVSLADPEVYGIPMLLLVGWRGQPGIKDEPQHMKQGRIMVPLIEALELPWTVLPQSPSEVSDCLREAVDVAKSQSSPYVIMVEKGTFAPYEREALTAEDPQQLPTREEALIALLEAAGDEGSFIATTGMLGRELYEYRETKGQSGNGDFLTIGGMGHASSVALGMAISDHDREVWCLDGDGSILMHMGTLAVVGHEAPSNFFHVIFNNGVHDSVGGQPTPMSSSDLSGVARSLGYRHVASLNDIQTLGEQVDKARAHGGPCLLDLRVRPGNRPGIGRPTRSPSQAKGDFMNGL